jgi:hypothetical protein
MHLDPEAYQRLQAEAERLGLQPSALAASYVTEALPVNPEADATERRRRGLAALKALDALVDEMRAAGRPEVDAVRVARASREELEKRSGI